MSERVQAHVAHRRSASATRERILATASELFYSQGIRATSADRIIDQVGVTKVTFYRHFRTKSDLVVAYLEAQGKAERAWLESIQDEGDPSAWVATLAGGIGEVSCRPGFRGCTFINAAAEYSDPEDPVRIAVAVYREWMLGYFAGLAVAAGARDVAAAAQQLQVLRDGAMIGGYLGDAQAMAAPLRAALEAVLGIPSARA